MIYKDLHLQHNFAPSHMPNQSLIKNEIWAPQTSINYGGNNHIYLTRVKNLKTNYQLNPSDNNET